MDGRAIPAADAGLRGVITLLYLLIFPGTECRAGNAVFCRDQLCNWDLHRKHGCAADPGSMTSYFCKYCLHNQVSRGELSPTVTALPASHLASRMTLSVGHVGVVWGKWSHRPDWSPCCARFWPQARGFPPLIYTFFPVEMLEVAKDMPQATSKVNSVVNKIR